MAEKCGKMCRCAEQLEHKVVLITGGNAGIGLETARDFVQRGATVVIAGRDEGRLVAAAGDISSSGGSGTVDTLLMDLADFSSVRKAAEKFRSKYSDLHILVNNAGIMGVPHRLTVDGNESQFQTNHLSHFLLTHLLLDLLKKSAPSRVINLSSGGHMWTYSGGIVFEDLTQERYYDQWMSYGQSKLANILFTTELAMQLAGSGVVTCAVHPGAVHTGLQYHATGIIGWVIRRGTWLMRSPEVGAQCSLHTALSSISEAESGAYWSDSAIQQPSAAARDPQMARQLWEASLRLCGL